MQINKVIFAGNLTRDPELKALPSGQNVCSVSLAANEVFTTKNGEKKESTEYGNIVIFGKQAENTAKYLKKGDSALVEGKLQTRSWEKDGVKMYRTEIIAQSVQFGGKRSDKTDSALPEYKAEEVTEEVPEIPF